MSRPREDTVKLLNSLHNLCGIKPEKQQNPQKHRQAKEGAKERERGGLYDRQAGRQAMIINRHKFKLSVTNLGLSLYLSLFLARGRPGHAHCVNKPHNDQKISEAATRVATRCAQAAAAAAAASPKNGSPKANTIRLSGAFAAGRQCEEEGGAGGGAGLLVLLAAGQAAYKIHKISALKSAAGQKLKT